MITIYKETDLNRRDGKVKIKEVVSVDTYKEALEKIEELQKKTTSANIKYYTGNIYK